MNKREEKMLSILRKGADEYGYVGVKAEFEAEGTRTDELLRLIELSRKADLKIGLKIGGCEAVRDLIESKQFGVEYIIAPMIETPYALSKFIDAKNKIYSVHERKHTNFLFNLETETAYKNRESLLSMSNGAEGTDGIVFGRVDFVLSRGIAREDTTTQPITDCGLDISNRCKAADQEFVVGGGISIDSLEALKQIAAVHLTRFETRKIIFGSDSLNLPQESIEAGLLEAIHFELLWLQNKRDHYRMIEIEDENRIEMLEARWNILGRA